MAARVKPSGTWGSDHYTVYTIGQRLGEPGGSATVYDIVERMRPPIAVKMFNATMRDNIRANRKLGARLVAMALSRDELMTAMPWATWPRRILVDRKNPPDLAVSVLGISMERLDGTIALDHFLSFERYRRNLSLAHTVHLAMTLSDHFARLHSHGWRFVVGDVSPKNVRIAQDFSQVYLIDTDAFTFDDKRWSYDFPIIGFTPTYNSPDSLAGKRVSAQHDDFVLAILLFQMLMAHSGDPFHPFDCGGSAPDQLIARRAFPLDNLQTLPIPDDHIAAYMSLPPELRAAFSRTFSGSAPVTAAEWVAMLGQYRRLL